MRIMRIIFSLLITVFFITIFNACNNGLTASETYGAAAAVEKNPEASAAAVYAAFIALEDGNFDRALSEFSKAVLYDETNPQALLGYSLLEIMNISVDPEIVSLAHNNLGLSEYPSGMRELVLDSIGGIVTSGLSPGVSGSPGDYFIPNLKRTLESAIFFLTHNTDFNELIDGMNSVFIDRINSVYSVIDTIPENAQICISGSITRFKDNNGQAQDVTIGKAEINIIAAYLLAFRSQVRLIQAYGYALSDLKLLYNTLIIDFLNGNTPDFNDIQTLFSALLLKPDIKTEEKLAGAKTDMQDMLVRLAAAVNSIKNRTGSDFSISPESSLVVGTDATDHSDKLFSELWNNFKISMDFTGIVCSVINESIAAGGGTAAYIPAGGSSADDLFIWMQNSIDSWPSESNISDSVGIDFGAFYTLPLITFNSIFDLKDTGEPQFYRWKSDNSGFEPTEAVPLLDDTDPFYYIKVNDISLSESIDLSMFPTDDPASSVFRIEDFRWAENSEPSNGLWDPGETIISINAIPNINGLIEKADWAGGEPAEYYWGPALIDYLLAGNISDTDLDNYTASENYSALRAALNGFTGSRQPDINYPVAVRDGETVFLALAEDMNIIVWHSLASAGETVTAGEETYTSTGSFWTGAASSAALF